MPAHSCNGSLIFDDPNAHKEKLCGDCQGNQRGQPARGWNIWEKKPAEHKNWASAHMDYFSTERAADPATMGQRIHDTKPAQGNNKRDDQGNPNVRYQFSTLDLPDVSEQLRVLHPV